jgi:hypothetical protein
MRAIGREDSSRARWVSCTLSPMDAFDIPLAHGTWRVERAAEKLALRDALPGANGWDRAAAAFRSVYGNGPRDHLLAPAFPTSWMVNCRAQSRTFQRWLAPPLRDHWRTLLKQTAGGPEAWLELPESGRAAVEDAVTALSIDGQGPCAISKSLALLVPETVPLMDDAAIALLTGAVPMPATADDPKATPSLFVPMLDAFARAVLDAEPQLVELARAHTLVPLDAAQVLDRLLWVDSWGHRVLRLP